MYHIVGVYMMLSTGWRRFKVSSRSIRPWASMMDICISFFLSQESHESQVSTSSSLLGTLRCIYLSIYLSAVSLTLLETITLHSAGASLLLVPLSDALQATSHNARYYDHHGQCSDTVGFSHSRVPFIDITSTAAAALQSTILLFVVTSCTLWTPCRCRQQPIL
jgi:hypothetical protein